MYKTITIEETIEKMCIEKGITCKFFSNKVFFKTNIAEWYINLDEHTNIRLFHNNYYRRSTSSKFGNSYHIQKRRFNSHKEIIDYIYNHDNTKFAKRPIKKCRMELLFDKIEQQGIRA
jgi:hypothetical protein